jgi:acyl-CoA thioesterase-1
MSKILALLLSILAFSAHSVSAAPTVLVFGDSLSAGYGIAVAQSWPALLEGRLRAERFPHAVVNASISGETTAGGKSRLPAALEQHHPAVVVLALGANDGLRGLPLAQSRANLETMIHAAKRAGARVLLVGMELPPNYGADYTRGFAAMFRELARREKVALLPFLLDPIALDDAAFQPDRLHPTAAAQPKLLEHVWTSLKPLLKLR